MARRVVLTVAKLAALFVGTLALFVLLLVGAARVPQRAIRDNMLRTASYLCEHQAIFDLVPNVSVSSVDRYADSILMSLVYYWDEDAPLESTMWSRYYGDGTILQNEYLLVSIRDNLEPTQEYLRYWHGSGVLLRPMHVVCSIREIYELCAIALLLLLAVLIAVLCKSRMGAEALCLCLSLASVSVWFVPFCLEYVWVFLIALAASALAVPLALRGRHEWLMALFLLVGMTTAYADFLTSETLTLTIPLLLVVRAGAKGTDADSPVRQKWGLTVCYGILWLVGYAGAWACKWAIASAVLGEDVMPYVSGHVAERIDRFVGLTPMQYLWGALSRNVALMSPMEYGPAGAAVACALAVGFVAYVACGGAKDGGVVAKHADWHRILLFFCIGLVPYLRFLVLHAHAWQHSRFTYRAQAAAVLAVCLIVLELRGRVGKREAEQRA